MAQWRSQDARRCSASMPTSPAATSRSGCEAARSARCAGRSPSTVSGNPVARLPASDRRSGTATAGCAGSLSTVGQFRRARPAGYQDQVGAGPFQQPCDHFDRHVVEHRERDGDLVEFARLGEIVHRGIVQFVQFAHQPYDLLGNAVIPSRRRCFARDVVEHLPDLFLDGGRRDRPAAGRARRPWRGATGRAGYLTGRSSAEAEDLDQFVVPVGAGDDGGIARFGKMRARHCSRGLRITLPLPRSTITSVTSSGRSARPEIASR